jgi:hypothetical protein
MVEVLITFHQVDEWLHSFLMDCLPHFFVAPLDMLHVVGVPFFEHLNEVFSPLLPVVLIALHFPHRGIEGQVNINDFGFTGPKLYLSGIRKDVLYSVNEDCLNFFEKHSPAVKLLIAYKNKFSL